MTFFENQPETEYHMGDCTNEAQSCFLCGMEQMLKDYREYFFDEDKWRKINLPTPRGRIKQQKEGA